MVNLVRIRESKISKYDITLKKLISLDNARLRDILELPRGGFLLREQFPDWDELRSDTLYYRSQNIYHVEFQTENSSEMPLRMFDYFGRIQTHWKNALGRPLKEIFQQVLYIGSDNLTMSAIFQRGRTTHEFDLKDLKRFSEKWFGVLERSPNPEDWILGSLTAQDLGEAYWLDLAERIVSHIQQTAPPATDLPALLIIAAVLRKVDPRLQEEIEKMVRINIGSSRVLRQIYDEGSREFALKQMLRVVEIGLEQKGFFITAEQAAFISEFSFDDVSQLNFLAIAGSDEEIENFITPPSPDDDEHTRPRQLE
ncbi:hypothetical protein [Neorhizobium vignae]|uniref:hypothetical protein n=1 Tax=Neorhizobium vignae TaxID=690585 RepID=UPI00056ACC82|nr:hypothetical protein [Neorhizobium vignae]